MEPDRTPQNDAYEAIFTALAHPARRRIAISLHFAGGTMSAGEIARLFGHAWPTTTRHLKLMQAAGLLTEHRDGRRRIYRLDIGRIALAGDWLAWFGRDPVTAKEIDHDGDSGRPAVQAQHRGRRA